MDSIRGLLHGATKEVRAALAVELLQQCVAKHLNTTPDEVRVLSLRSSTATIQVVHGALAARAQQQADEILLDANKKITQQLPGYQPVEKLVCRVMG